MFKVYKENVTYYIVSVWLAERIMKKMNNHKIYFKRCGKSKDTREVGIIEKNDTFIDIYYPLSATLRAYISEKEIKNIPDNYKKNIIGNVLIVEITDQIILELVIIKKGH